VIAELHAALTLRLDAAARCWLEDAISRVRHDASAIEVLYPAAGRAVGRCLLHEGDEPDFHAWTVDEAARTLLLDALGSKADVAVFTLYRHGDAAERRGVLRALAFLQLGDRAVELVEDALRSNDPGQISAALGPYAFDHLSDSAIAHAVLKCVFMEVPVSGLPGLDKRVTPELSRMLAEYVHERVAAGRDVNPEVWPLIERHPPEPQLAAIAGELLHDDVSRRRAAQEALASRP
jgi:hypothetical protein